MTEHSAKGSAASKLELLLGYLEFDPQNVRLLADSVEAAFEAGETEQALNLLGRYREQEAVPAWLRDLEGHIYIRTGRFSEAAQVFTELRADAPSDPSLAYNLALAQGAQGQEDAALAVLDDAAVSAGPHAAVLRVELLVRADRPTEAITAGEALLKAYPSHSGLLAAIAVAGSDADDLERAATYANAAGEHPDALAILGTIALSKGDVDTADRLVDRALALNASNQRALYAGALTALADGNGPRAEALLKSATEINPNAAQYWSSLGWAQLMQKRTDEAEASFRSAIRLDEQNEEVLAGLAMVQLLAGRSAEAKDWATKALQIDASSEPALAVLSLQDGAGEAYKHRLEQVMASKTGSANLVGILIQRLGFKAPPAA